MKKYIVEVYATRIEWNYKGKLDREGGPAIEYANGDKLWYRNGLPHREDGPAVEYANGDKHWYRYGKLHREDGPADEYANGQKYWFLNDEELTEKEFNTRMRKHSCDGQVVFYSGWFQWHGGSIRDEVDPYFEKDMFE